MRLSLILLSITIFAVPCMSQSSVSIVPDFSYMTKHVGPGDDNTYCVALGDVDGDGDLDLAAANDGQNAVYLNEGTRHWETGVAFGPLTDMTRYVAFGDVDRDGDLDLAVANDGQQNAIYLNNGSGLVGNAISFGAASGKTYCLAFADVDGDGDLDLAAGNRGEQNTIHVNNDGRFDVEIGFGTGNDETSSVAVGDMDGDGDLDLAVGNIGQQNAVYLNDGNGRFDQGIDFGTGRDQTNSVALGDVDGDGDLDLAVGNKGKNVIYLSDSGKFDAAINFGGRFATSTSSVALGDMDGDGDLDIAVGDAEWQQNWVYLNEGDGHFEPGSTLGIGVDYTESVALGDVDGDGTLDVAVGNSRSQQNVVYLSDSAGNSDAGSRFYGTGSENSWAVEFGDVDGDGDLDLVVGNNVAHEGQQNVIYVNDGTGHFDTAIDFGTPQEETVSVALGDVDSDGDLDIAVGDRDGRNAVYLNDSTGHFSTGIDFETNDNTHAVAFGDVDGDGDLDLAVGNTGTGDYQNVVYLNDGNGHFDSGLEFGTGSDTTHSLAFGDVDGDGDLDLAVGNGRLRPGLTEGLQNVVYLNDGTGHFDTGINFGTGSDHTFSVVFGDLDGDDDLDLVVGNQGEGFGEQNYVYLNDGTGHFDTAIEFGTGSDATWFALALGDADGDGDLDIAVGNAGVTGSTYSTPGEQNMVYLNDGTGHFDVGVYVGTGSDVTTALAWADVDGDGDLDLAVANTGQQNVVHLNNGSGRTAIPSAVNLWSEYR